jgi:hypothetical protein
MAEGTSQEQKITIAHDLADKLASAVQNVEGPMDRAGCAYYAMQQMPLDVREDALQYYTGITPAKVKIDEPKYKLPDPPEDPTPEAVEQWFVKACFVIAEMLTEKRKAYGDNLSDTQRILQVLYPEGIPPSAYSEVLVMVRIFDKFKRRANFHRNPESWVDDENPWLDVSGYGVAILYDIMRGAIKCE